MQTPIRVAQIMGKWHGGGVESIIMNYYRNIDRTKIQFDFICDSDSTSIPYEEINKLGGKVIIVPPYQHLFKYNKELKKVLKENNYNIVHSHISSLSIFPLRIAKKLNIPVRIAHNHTTSNRKEFKRNLIKKTLRPFSKKYANYYFACSNKAAKWLFGNNTDVEIIHNAIDYNKFKYNSKIREKLRKKYNISDDTIVIGHIGRFVQVKNHEYIIDIFNEVHKTNPNTLLVLAGKGPLLNKVKNKVNKLGLEKNVLFLGQIDNAHEIYQIMDVFILPSLYEGLPVVGIEAQVSKTPCLFSNKITKDAKITNTTKFIGISKKDISLWKEKVLKTDTTKNKSNNLSDTYNIKIAAKRLEDKYLDLYKHKKVIMHLVSTSVFSGSENVACQIINNYKDDNYEMIYTSMIGLNKKPLEERNIKYHDLKKFNYITVRKAIKTLNPSIIHAHDTKAIVLAALFYKNRTVIGHIHGNHLNLRKLTPKSVLLRLVSKRLKKLIWVSDSSLDNYKYLNKVKDKSIILYNMIDSKEIKEKVKLDEKTYPKYDLVYLGRLSKEKDPIKLIEIIKLTVKEKPNLKAAIIGTGELEETVKNKIKEYDLDKNIDMYGFISNPYKILDSSKIMIMTSIYEGTPMCALEAISLGKPIITTPVDGMLKIITNNKTGYIVKKNIDFKDSILSLINNPSKYKEFSNNQLESSKVINNIDNYIKEIEKIYRG